MHLMFVDESGDPGYPPDGNWPAWKGSSHFVRVGVIIHGWRWKAWHRRLLNFKQTRGLLWDAEIKGSHLRTGKGVFIGWEESRRLLFRSDLAKLIGYSREITLVGVAIDKKKVNTLGRERIMRPEVRSLELLLERYNHFLNQQSDKAWIVILDPVEESKDDNLRHFQSYLLDQGQNFQHSHIVEGAFFAKSHTSNLLQVADFAANVFYQHAARANGGDEYEALKPRFWRWKGRTTGYGVKIWPE